MNGVEEQYTNWVYPIPIEDMRAAIANNQYIEFGDPLLWWPLYWPKKRGVEKLDILIAGCGSVQASYYACRNPNWNVLGVDISENSLAHQEKLKEKHNLTNLRLLKHSLVDIGSLGENFDFIVSTGVIHHLPDPDAGLLALRNVLRPAGVMNLMVYGSSLRLGVYLMQEVFRTLGFNQTQEDVDIVKATIASLSQDHVVKKYVKNAPDLHYDAAYVDTFLHRQDRAYNVREVYEFTRRAGLEFISWIDPLAYNLESCVPKTHALWQRLKHLTPEVSAHICDLLIQEQGTHRWAVGHPDYVRSIQIPFNDETFFDSIVFLHRAVTLLKPANPANNEPALLKRDNKEFEIDSLTSSVIELCDQTTSICQALSYLSINASDVLAKKRIRESIRALWGAGHVSILLPESIR